MKKVLLAAIMCLFPVVSYAASATLTWNANTEADLAGYKVYRGNGTCSVGPLQPLIVNGSAVSVLAPSTSYTDTTVPTFDGLLCYEVTAFDTSGNESVHSVRAQKTVSLNPPVAPVGLTIGVVAP
jgi:hypothetical protein